MMPEMVYLIFSHDIVVGFLDCLADDTTNYPLCTTFSTQSLVESARRSGTLFDYCWILELFQASTKTGLYCGYFIRTVLC
jgi:hypothetical protein